MKNSEPKTLKYPFLYTFLSEQKELPINWDAWYQWQNDFEKSLNKNDEGEKMKIFKDCISILTNKLEKHLQDPFDKPVLNYTELSSFVVSRPEHLQHLKNTITKSYEMRIEYLRKLASSLEPKNQPKEIELAKQVLAVYYLYEAAGGSLAENYRVDLARLIQFLTGRELENPRIENTNIYKKVKNLFGKNEIRNAKNLQAIKPFFDNLGLEKIAQTIENEMIRKK